jgi:hypothetical protein
MPIVLGDRLQDHFEAGPARSVLPAGAFQRGARDNSRFFGRNEKPAGYIILPEASYEAVALAANGAQKVGSYKVFNSFPVGDATLSRLQRAATSKIEIYPDRETADQLADYKNWTSQVESRDMARSQPVAYWQKNAIRYDGVEQGANPAPAHKL